MSTAIWGIIAVLVIGTAIVAYGWWSDRVANRRREEALALPPDREIPGFRPEPVHPEYLSELQASIRPSDLPNTELTGESRHELTQRLKGSPTFPAGWTSRAFITDPSTGWCVLREPLVLVCADAIERFRELLPFADHVVVAHLRLDGRAIKDTTRNSLPSPTVNAAGTMLLDNDIPTVRTRVCVVLGSIRGIEGVYETYRVLPGSGTRG